MEALPEQWIAQLATLVAVVNLLTGLVSKILADAAPAWQQGRSAVLRLCSIGIGIGAAFVLKVAIGGEGQQGYLMAGLLAAALASGGSAAWKRVRNLVAAKTNVEGAP